MFKSYLKISLRNFWKLREPIPWTPFDTNDCANAPRFAFTSFTGLNRFLRLLQNIPCFLKKIILY